LSNGEFMIIDGIPVEINDEKNLLELIRKTGIKMPTFCYHSELSIHGACRMCMVEDQNGNLDAACSSQPKAGMEIRTNTETLRRHRKMILELLLSNHCRDCTACGSSENCKLQDLAMRFNIGNVRFHNTSPTPKRDISSLCITRDQSKCILCGDCVRMCNEVQNVGAIDFSHRGSRMTVGSAFGEPLADSECVGCGQCAAVCPTGALIVRNDTNALWRDLDDKRGIEATVQIAPAVRVAMGKQLRAANGENAMGKIVAALRRMGFDQVFDTSTGADMTVLEEADEFLERLEREENLPLFTSCCPAWVNYCEKKYPELLPLVSTCRSPMQMFASVIKKHYSTSCRRVIHVAVMPCTAKKFEAARPEFSNNGAPNVDYVITTQELIQMIQESGIVFSELEPDAVDIPFASASGAGMIFGVTGGVTEAVLRRISSNKTPTELRSIALKGVRGMKGVKEAVVMTEKREVRIAIVSGLKNASELIERIKAGERYDFVEVMACPGGCISGAGQPYVPEPEKELRGKGLYMADKISSIKRAEENPLMMSLYDGILKDNSHKLLHVSYAKTASAP
jgi:NADH-quinone oxidoreductase subunit G